MSGSRSLSCCLGLWTVLFVLVFSTVTAWSGPAYRRLLTNAPDTQSWRNGIFLSVDMDVAACKKAYGERWVAECQAPAPGRSGQRVEGIRMTPSTPGVWRWTSDTGMQFTPERHLSPDTTYTISLDQVRFPARYSLNKNIIYRTQPQAVHIDHETMWIDPSAKGAHVLSVPLTFIWPMNRALLERNVRITPASGEKNLRFGAMHFVWNEGNDGVVVNVPVLSLPAKTCAATFTVSGIPAWHLDKGKRIVEQQARGQKSAQAVSSLSVTGTDRVMDVKNIAIETVYDQNLNREYQLVVTTSMQTKAGDVLDKLDLLLLPKKATPAGRDTNWESMPALSSEDIANSVKISPELIVPRDEVATEIRLRLPVEAKRGVMCAMKTGLASVSGFTLNRVRRFIRTVPGVDPEVNFLQPGNVLALRAGQKLDVHSVGVERIEWEAAEVRTPFLALAALHNGFVQESDEDSEAKVDLLALSTVRRGSIDLSKAKLGQASYTALDLADLEGKKEAENALIRVRLKGFVGGEERCSCERLLLISDLGLMLKTQSDGSHVAFVRRLSTGEAVAHAEVQLLGANGLPVVSAATSSDGVATLASTYGLAREKRPVACVAILDKQYAWLSLDDAQAKVQYSDFAVEGRHAAAGGLMASVFTERGVYMPGETLHFGTILRNQNWTPLSSSLPLMAVLYSPTGSEVLRQKIEPGPDGLATLSWNSSPQDPTGTYLLNVGLADGTTLSSVLGSVSTRVEEFQPDTMALRLDYAGNEPKGWINSGESGAKVRVFLENLYGEPAVGNRVRASFHAEPRILSFKKYPDFVFSDKGGVGDSKDIALPELVTDEKGEAFLELPLEAVRLGTHTGLLEVECFEKSGGRAVSRVFSRFFSPRSYVLGYKPENGANNLNYIPEGSKADLRLLLVNNNLDPVSLKGVNCTLSARRFVTSLVSDSRGLYRYDSLPVDTKLGTERINIENGQAVLALKTDEPGDYLITFTDPDGLELAQIPFTVAGNKLAAPGQEPVLANGSLRLTLDKDSYKAGETIHFQLSAPYQGTGLVTIERDQVVAHAWFTAEPGESVHEITIPEGFEGRGFLNVSFVRDQKSPAIYMDPHVYGVVPFSCGISARDMGLSLSAPDSVKPGEEVTIRVSSQKEGRVQLFCVDEGVLQLTSFSLPDPLKDLLTDRALDVESREAFHLLMPDHERLRGRIPGFGGGMGNAGGRFLNPFRRKSEPPFAFWASLVNVGKEPAQVTVKIPDYFSGAFRIMAVGSGASADVLSAGAVQKKARVRGSIILKPQLPLVVAPGDTFQGALVVANTIEGSGAQAKIKVSMKFADVLSRSDKGGDVTLTVPENSERVIPFAVKVGEGLGETDVLFQAESGQVKAKRSQSLSVRPATPLRTTERVENVSDLPLEGQRRLLASERSLYAFKARTELAVAQGPVLALRALLDRLDAYPYGCTEQTISKAMPFVALRDQPALRDLVLKNPRRDLKKQVERGDVAIASALSAIRSSLVYDGVSIWPGQEANLFVTAYAGDFLVSLNEHGLRAPEDLSDRILSILEDQVGRTPENVEDGRVKIYAAWILQRDGRIMTSQLSSLEDWFSKNTNGWENDVLASLLADSFSTLRLKRRAQARLPKGMVQVTTDPLFSTAMARSLHAMVLARGSDLGEVKQDVYQSVLDAAFSPNATTIDLAMSGRSLAYLAGSAEGGLTSFKASCLEWGPDFANDANESASSSLFVLDAPGCKRFALQPAGNAGALSVLLSEEGYDRKVTSSPSGKIELSKKLLAADHEVSSVSLGDVVTSKICVRTPGKDVKNVVIVDLVPGGLEPVLDQNVSAEEGLLRFERREDRGIFFVNASPSERCFSYKLRATSKGRFVVPQTSAEAMYEPALSGVSKGASLEVK